jgi:hypothetical protein
MPVYTDLVKTMLKPFLKLFAFTVYIYILFISVGKLQTMFRGSMLYYIVKTNGTANLERGAMLPVLTIWNNMA